MRIHVGVDAARSTHWVVALDEGGRVVLDRAVENDAEAIDALIEDLQGFDEEIVIGLDVVGSIARFLEVMLLSEGLALVHAPCIAVNRAAQGLCGGERKSEPKDARNLAYLVRTRDLRPILAVDDTRITRRLKVGRRRELMPDRIRRLTRLRGPLCDIHLGLERSLDVPSKGPLTLLARYLTPGEIHEAGWNRRRARLAKTPHLRAIDERADEALAAARAQRLAVPGETSRPT